MNKLPSERIREIVKEGRGLPPASHIRAIIKFLDETAQQKIEEELPFNPNEECRCSGEPGKRTNIGCLRHKPKEECRGCDKCCGTNKPEEMTSVITPFFEPFDKSKEPIEEVKALCGAVNCDGEKCKAEPVVGIDHGYDKVPVKAEKECEKCKASNLCYVTCTFHCSCHTPTTPKEECRHELVGISMRGSTCSQCGKVLTERQPQSPTTPQPTESVAMSPITAPFTGKPDWQKEFDEKFVDDGLVGGDDGSYVTADEIKSFISQVSSESYERGKEEGYKKGLEELNK